jgi:hypothetical protein
MDLKIIAIGMQWQSQPIDCNLYVCVNQILIEVLAGAHGMFRSLDCGSLACLTSSATSVAESARER